MLQYCCFNIFEIDNEINLLLGRYILKAKMLALGFIFFFFFKFCLTRSQPTIFHDVYHIHHIFHDVYHIYYLGPSHMPHDVFIRHSKVKAA